jgi:hypothetical protein
MVGANSKDVRQHLDVESNLYFIPISIVSGRHPNRKINHLTSRTLEPWVIRLGWLSADRRTREPRLNPNRAENKPGFGTSGGPGGGYTLRDINPPKPPVPSPGFVSILIRDQ